MEEQVACGGVSFLFQRSRSEAEIGQGDLVAARGAWKGSFMSRGPVMLKAALRALAFVLLPIPESVHTSQD